VILVHSFSRFFRDQFQLEFYVRRLAKNGVRLVSITQELGDDPMSDMIRPDHGAVRRIPIQRECQAYAAGDEGERAQGFWTARSRRSAIASWKLPSSAATAPKKILEIDVIQAEPCG